MKYSKIFTFVLIALFLEGCSSYKQISFDAYDTKNKYSYRFKIPRGFHSNNFVDLHAMVYTYSYRDSSMFLITDKPGGFISEEKHKQYGKYVYMIMFTTDTTIGGLQNDSLYWKERKFGKAYLSYYDVPKEKKAEFDSILNHISLFSVSKIKYLP